MHTLGNATFDCCAPWSVFWGCVQSLAIESNGIRADMPFRLNLSFSNTDSKFRIEADIKCLAPVMRGFGKMTLGGFSLSKQQLALTKTGV